MWVFVFAAYGIVSEFDELLLSVFSIVVNVDFGIDAENSVAGVCGPRVDFNLGGINLVEEVVKVENLLLDLSTLVCESQFFSDVVDIFLRNTKFWVDELCFDQMREIFSDFFDFNSSIFRVDDSGSLGCSVKEERQIELLLDVDTFVDENSVDLQT
jgi:hypothetical protein